MINCCKMVTTPCNHTAAAKIHYKKFFCTIIILLFSIFLNGQKNVLIPLNTSSRFSSNGKYNKIDKIAFIGTFIDKDTVFSNALIIKDLNSFQEVIVQENIEIVYLNWFDSTNLIYIEEYKNSRDSLPFYFKRLNLYSTVNKQIVSFELPSYLFNQYGFSESDISELNNYVIFKTTNSYFKAIKNLYVHIIEEKIYTYNLLSQEIKYINSSNKYETNFRKIQNENIEYFEYYYFKGKNIKSRKITIKYPEDSDPEDRLLDGEYLYYSYLLNDTNYLVKFNRLNNKKKIIGAFKGNFKIDDINPFKENSLLLTIVDTKPLNPIKIDTIFYLKGFNIEVAGNVVEENLYLYTYFD